MVDAIQTGVVRHDLLTLMDLLKSGKIKPLIAHRLPLQEARRAHEMLGEGGVLGKIVLQPSGYWLGRVLIKSGSSSNVRLYPNSGTIADIAGLPRRAIRRHQPVPPRPLQDRLASRYGTSDQRSPWSA